MGFIILGWCAKNQSATPDHQFHERYLSDFELVSMPGTMTVDAENGSSQLSATRNANGSLRRAISHALAALVHGARPRRQAGLYFSSELRRGSRGARAEAFRGSYL